MLAFVLRCYRVPLRVGKVVRHAIRKHWGLSHHAAHAVYHAGIGSILVSVPVVWAALPPAQSSDLQRPDIARVIAIPEPSRASMPHSPRSPSAPALRWPHSGEDVPPGELSIALIDVKWLARCDRKEPGEWLTLPRVSTS